LLAALLAISLVTLGAAAIVLLPPLRDQLRDESVRSTEAATTSQIGSFNELIERGDCPGLSNLAFQLGRQTGADVYVVNQVPQPFCELLPSIDAGGDLMIQRSLTLGVDDQAVNGDDLQIVHILRGGNALIVREQLSDVAGAVDEVYSAFSKAAVIGLVAALVLGLVLAGALVRRLERLRRAALRVTTEGAGAPRPADDGRDEIGDLARSFAAMQGSLLRQEEARRAFVATASHELRTPLTSLSGMLELIDEDLTEGRLDLTDAHQQIVAARRELRRLNNLAAELLDLSRLDAGVELRSEPVELGELTRAIGSEFEQRARERSVDLDVVPPIGPCWAKGDPGAVARILRILVDNALRFSPEREAIRIAAHYSGEHAVIEVTDRGPGVPDNERELIFQRFQRGSRTGGEGGFGLGLAIGRELATRLGGTLELREGGGQGATFVCALPLEPPATSPR
jgi:signal transduction histidine kinase